MIKRLLIACAVLFGIHGHAHAANDYFDSGDYTALTDHTLARASAVNSVFQAIEVGFDRVQTNSAAFLTATSTTVVEIGTGSKAFTIGSGKAFLSGSLVMISSAANTANYMFGTVTAYSGTTLTVNVQVVGGSGTLNDWNISMTGLRGLQGPAGSGTGDLLAANNLSDVANAATARTNLGTVAKAGDTFTGTTGVSSTDAGATEGPVFFLDRNSASPAVSDVTGSYELRGRDSGGNSTNYSEIKGEILDPTNGSEDGRTNITALVAGAETTILKLGPGVQIGAPSGADKGAGSLNVDGLIYQDGVALTTKASFHAHKNGTNQTNIASTDTKVTFTTETHDDNGDYNAGTSTFTAPRTADYLVSVSLNFDAVGSPGTLETSIYVNGAEVRTHYVNAQSAAIDKSNILVEVIRVTAGQTIEIYGRDSTAASNGIIVGVAAESWFSIREL